MSTSEYAISDKIGGNTTLPVDFASEGFLYAEPALDQQFQPSPVTPCVHVVTVQVVGEHLGESTRTAVNGMDAYIPERCPR